MSRKKSKSSKGAVPAVPTTKTAPPPPPPLPPQCVLDPKVLNRHSIYHMTDMGLSIFAVLCGQNRGAFVLQNSTYSCLELPAAFGVRAGIDASSDPNKALVTANDISEFVCSVV